MLTPLGMLQIMFRNQYSTSEHTVPTPGTMKLPDVLKIVTDSFTSATERHIEVGDGLEMFVVRLPPGAASSSGAEPDKENPVVGAASVNLEADFGAVEALGGEDEQTPKATMIIRRELKKD